MKNYKFSTAFVTFYLLIYTLLFHFNVSMNIMLFMFSISPVLVLWMAYTILKHAPFDGRELNEDEEWGYGDR